ncbi:putative quinol monooxygenase [Tritonibacter horizontis]|uniref:Autoinducer-2 (AI-2) modifying protein LsrG n=1 Tax=Tritonibacter horizontis TaxID=1768241 RepID=A0A132C000_9RHOB|nr:putative quinol monooxygenase [Tritonibacter horizontis]KUP93370.1 autoinducer-2 (AI-2) modifying protein LsrG [Tritonibacter horizontis]
MYVVTVTFTLLPGCLTEFLPLMVENARRSLAEEPGCQQFDVCTARARSPADEVFLYEIYDDEAAFAAHLDSAHFKAFDAAVAGFVAAKDVRLFREVLR